MRPHCFEHNGVPEIAETVDFLFSDSFSSLQGACLTIITWTPRPPLKHQRATEPTPALTLAATPCSP